MHYKRCGLFIGESSLKAPAGSSFFCVRSSQTVFNDDALYWLVRIQFVLRTTFSPVSIHPNQNGTMVKGELMRLENVLGKVQPSERHDVRVQAWRAAVGVLIGAGGARRYDWPPRV